MATACKDRQRYKRLHTSGAAVIVGLVVCLIRRHARRSMRQETDPSSKASQPQQSEVIVSTADWGDIACQQHAVMGMSPCMSLSQQNGRTMCVERAFTCSSKSLMMFLFHPASELWAKWETDRGLLDLAIGPWTKRDGPDRPWQIERSIRYRVPLKQFGNVGPSHAYTEETFTLHMVGPSGWAASVKAISPFVPMGKCFQVDLQLAAEDFPDGGCKMCVTGAVNFYKPNRLGELLIRRPALAAMQKTYMALFDLISEQDLAYVGPPTPTTLRHDQDLRPPSLQGCSRAARVGGHSRLPTATARSANIPKVLGPMVLMVILWVAVHSWTAVRQLACWPLAELRVSELLATLQGMHVQR